jgi:hypothetical protein
VIPSSRRLRSQEQRHHEADQKDQIHLEWCGTDVIAEVTIGCVIIVSCIAELIKGCVTGIVPFIARYKNISLVYYLAPVFPSFSSFRSLSQRNTSRTTPGHPINSTRPSIPSMSLRHSADMVLLANPRGNHFIHLALLGTLLLFDFLAMTMSAALVQEGKGSWFGESF